MTEPRTQAPPARRTLQVTGSEELGAYRLLTAADPDGPDNPRPGQFYMLAAAERWGGGADERPYLPRAFSHARVRHGPDGVELQFLLDDVGPGTARLAELRPGDGLHATGPLGVGFRVPDAGRVVLAGGGVGTAPLLCLSDELGDGAPVLLGFRRADHAEAAALFGPEPEVATEDGSSGRQALVTDLLAEALDGHPDSTVMSCGPPAMLEAVRELCEARGVPAQLALEAGMACGYGACFGCAVPTREGYVRLCLDGPVIDADALDSALVAH